MNLTVCLLTLALAVGAPKDRESLERQLRDFADRASKMKKGDAERLEQMLASGDSEDASTRAQLVAFYARPRPRTLAENNQLRKHIEWFVMNRPTHPVLGLPVVNFTDHWMWDTVSDAWRQQLRNPECEAVAIGNAADWFWPTDRRFAIELYERAEAADPSNPEWPTQRAILLLMWAEGYEAVNRNAAAKANAAFKRAQRLRDAPLPPRGLQQAAIAALLAEDYSTAQQLAETLIESAVASGPDHLFYSESVHWGNVILGHLAIREHDLERAEACLLRAARIQRTVSITSALGPDLSLARELVAHDRRETVCRYLRLCGRFWRSPLPARWIERLNTGGAVRLENDVRPLRNLGNPDTPRTSSLSE